MDVDSSLYTYTDPIFMGSNWFIKCSEDDGARLVVASGAKTLKAALALARRRVVDMPLTVGRFGSYTTRAAFPPAFSGLRGAWSFTVNINGLMPETGCYAARIGR